jgi:hypothetical protein
MVNSSVTFQWSGCPGVYPRQQLTGVILDECTSRQGERFLLVQAAELNLPKWVRLQDVRFPVKPTTAEAVAA